MKLDGIIGKILWVLLGIWILHLVGLDSILGAFTKEVLGIKPKDYKGVQA